MHMDISQEIKNEALAHAQQRMQYEYDRFNLTIEQRQSMILIGTIGQLLFKRYLDENNVRYEYEMQAGQYDAMDFSINNEIVEIKTSGFEDHIGFNHMNIFYSLDQYQSAIRKDFVYCVQIFIDGYNRNAKLLNLDACNNGHITGYIPFAQFPQYRNPQKRFYGDDYVIPINQLHPIGNLIDI